MPDLKHMTEQLRPHLAENANYPKILKLDFKGEGVLRVEGIRVDNEDGPADCTILVALADFEAISKGEIDPADAFREGRLRIDGDMGVAMALQPYFARAWS